ncbi:hypothetical protein HNP37_000011 [Flavobacterium nitrogenifigens]|uniref:Uncharacterized protein n=2 Tax=Flavobacterium TaxID=237 RepID=A0A7W7ISY6_9FLAO|nr:MULTISPECIES: hypothetical protein [Flavobacterium]MBB4799972.1 hypothetical protein [Flavobacterium nitrogenifigens]MBB6386278.1 hypothetical protein [Flavobacterium notoginsengisoli]
MKETIEFRINSDFSNLLFEENEGKKMGASIKVVEISKDDPRYVRIPEVAKMVKEKYDRAFFFGWKIIRKYTKSEINSAQLFQLKIKTVFQPTGEESGTQYDEANVCHLCGANRQQIGSLKLKGNSLPKKDIAKTIGGEIIVSDKFIEVFKSRNLKGLELQQLIFNNKTSTYAQLLVNNELDLSSRITTGNDPFTFTTGSKGGTFNVSGYDIKLEREVYICPYGHLIGLNLLSEASVINSDIINDFDLFVSKQKLGVRRGLLIPEPVYFCSTKFRKIVEEEKLSGFDFEVANIVL